MNKDQVTGKIDQAVGKVKQGVGEAVGNEELANKGVIDQAKGTVKETWGNARKPPRKKPTGPEAGSASPSRMPRKR